MENSKAEEQLGWTGQLSFCLAALLLVLLPAAGKMRSPGGVSSEWYICAFLATWLLVLNVCGLKALWHRRTSSRLWLYFSLGIAVFACAILVDLAQEQRQFDHWAHRGIRYDPHD